MYNPKDENLQKLCKKIKENPKSFIFILGAGMSVPAGMPLWSILRDEMINYCEKYLTDIGEDCNKKITELRNMKDYWQTFGELENLLSQNEYRKFIASRLTDKDKTIPETYISIWKLGINGIITFNIDKLILNAYAKVKSTTVDFATAKDRFKYINYPTGDNQFVFFPHGEIEDPNSWVFTEKEKRNLYKDPDYKKLMCTLLNSRNLVIIGFDPQENSFSTLLNEISIGNKISGYDNYYIGADLKQADIKVLSDYGITCINYRPNNEMHTEVTFILRDLCNYIAKDEEAASIYKGEKYTEKDIPRPSEAVNIGITKLREILNGNIANIIPPNTVPTEIQIKELQEFYKRYSFQMHIAWFVDQNSEEGNSVYGYHLVSAIGRGAFGNVYEAYDDEKNRYALKILLPEVKDKVQYLSCFRRGIRSMNILRDNHVDGMVKIYSSYEVPACIIMDYVEGLTLREAVEKKILNSLDKKLQVISQIASIIYKAHSLKECILHRDLKPENVMLRDFYNEFSNEEINVVILDFDLSWHKGATELTVALGAMSQGFMAPEQVEENVKYKRNTAVDVYSIGMLAFFILTGENPAPYQHKFHSFEEDLENKIRSTYHMKWKCLSSFLTNVIKRSSLHQPEDRIALSGFISNINLAYRLVVNDEISYSHPMFLREIAYIIDNEAEIDESDFGRKIISKQDSLGKKIILELKQVGKNPIMMVKINKLRQGHDKRNPKYLERAKEKALACVDKKYFYEKRGEIEISAISIYLNAKLSENIKREVVHKMAENIQTIRSAMELQ